MKRACQSAIIVQGAQKLHVLMNSQGDCQYFLSHFGKTNLIARKTIKNVVDNKKNVFDI